MEKDEKLPFVAFSNDELDAALPLGAVIVCPSCGQEHAVIQSNPPTEHSLLQFYKCGGETYLCGVSGKSIMHREAN